ncbi:hypothetical protein KY346_00510 [Candidatus Woesearchaeota archaeon]|nr:hypothetical protein [Candidatus Woesearchaeota archaeon]
MATRKIVQHGSSSLTITLPIKWINKNKLHKGDEIQIVEEGHYLIVGGRGRKEILSKTITVSDKISCPTIMHYTAALYRAGYDHIEFAYNNAEIYNAIDKVVGSDLNGLDITENKKNFCVLESISMIDQSQFKSILKKLLFSLSEFSKDSLESIKTKNINEIKMAMTKESIINRNANFCERILTKVGYEDIDQIPFLFYIIKELENIGDEYYSICKYYLKQKKIDKKTLKLFKETNDSFTNFKNLFLKQETEKALKIEDCSKLHSEIQEKTKELYSSLEANDKDDCILHHLCSIIRRIKSCLGSLFSIMIVREEEK